MQTWNLNGVRATISYPFHIAKCAVTPHWTPLSIHPLCCCYTPVCFHTECRISAFWRVRFKKRSKIEQKDIITPMHCLAFPSALFGAPFHIDNRTVANCGFWLEYASKTPLEVGADLPRRMRLFWLRCQIMRLRSVHIKPLHYSQNAFDSALLAWYERGIIPLSYRQMCSHSALNSTFNSSALLLLHSCLLSHRVSDFRILASAV